MNDMSALGTAAFATPKEALDAARAACEAGALAQAQAIWEEVQDRFHPPVGGWRRQVAALRQARLPGAAEALLQASARWFDDGRIRVELATMATDRGDWPEAARRWAEVRALFPDNARAFFAEARALRRCGRLEEATALAAAGECRFPERPEPMIEDALAAEDRRDQPAALLAWERMRQRFPDHPVAYIRGMALLLEAGRLDAAEALAAEAIHRFPDHPIVLGQRWRIFRARFPEDPAGYANAAAALVAAGRPDEADALLGSAHDRFPADFSLTVQWLTLAADRQDWDAAVRRCEQLRLHLPNHQGGYLRGVIMLRNAGRLDEAEALATEAVRLFPEVAAIAVEHAKLAQDREDWPVALIRWRHVRSRFPDDLRAVHGLGWVVAALGWEMAAGVGQQDAVLPEAAADNEADDAAALRAMFMQFEGLGDNCEFGLVQRRYGAEPLGLLRWGGFPSGELIDSLDNDFALFTAPANIDLFCKPGREYILTVPKAGFRMHTFTRDGSVPYDKLMQQTTRRLLFLRNKLLSDLRDGEKIFVQKPIDGLLSDEVLERAFVALRRHGPGTLLGVRLADEDHAAGSVEIRAPGLMVGYIDRVSPDAFAGTISYGCWLTICRNAARLHASMRGALAGPVEAVAE